jgi:lipid II:glycine glycyltransferase (peptidoglycan interpeptide bridge formation enzyme)
MELVELRDPLHLNGFVSQQERAQFCQSWAWGQLEQEEGGQVWRLGVRAEGELVAAATLTTRTLPLGLSYLYSPRGPVITDAWSGSGRREALAIILGGARRIAESTPRLELAVRLEPPLAPSLAGMLRSLDLVPTSSVQPSRTQLIALAQEPQQLLASMHPKTRYNIGLAERHNIVVWREENTAKGLEEFGRLSHLTAERHSLKLHSGKHYSRMLRLLDGQSGNPAAELWLAGIHGEAPLAAAITINWGDTVTYVHGASDPAFKHLMAPHLLQWRLILNAQALGYQFYDFWGIAPANQPKHPWAGFTRFKEGFGGSAAEYVGTWDYVQQPGWYHVYQLYRRIRGRR